MHQRKKCNRRTENGHACKIPMRPYYLYNKYKGPFCLLRYRTVNKTKSLTCTIFRLFFEIKEPKCRKNNFPPKNVSVGCLHIFIAHIIAFLCTGIVKFLKISFQHKTFGKLDHFQRMSLEVINFRNFVMMTFG